MIEEESERLVENRYNLFHLWFSFERFMIFNSLPDDRGLLGYATLLEISTANYICPIVLQCYITISLCYRLLYL